MRSLIVRASRSLGPPAIPRHQCLAPHFHRHHRLLPMLEDLGQDRRPFRSVVRLIPHAANSRTSRTVCGCASACCMSPLRNSPTLRAAHGMPWSWVTNNLQLLYMIQTLLPRLTPGLRQRHPCSWHYTDQSSPTHLWILQVVCTKQTKVAQETPGQGLLPPGSRAMLPHCLSLMYSPACSGKLVALARRSNHVLHRMQMLRPRS